MNTSSELCVRELWGCEQMYGYTITNVKLQRSIMTSVSPKLLNFDSFNDIVRPLFYCDFMQVLFYWLSFCIFL